ncbi:hypothetical protein [Sphingomonas beigongshangi]|uniref:hypothetical protein n=1 Tax=Sphingomonas beigongshangi TaxID=2782540 RepID=UPI00193C18A2|nr:hypothetical protein [Sphingomonas beigongshangi]
MIFARRALQRRLDELRQAMPEDAVKALSRRLNVAGRDRMAAMWEVVVLHGLSFCGTLAYEQPLASGRRPDVRFEGGRLAFTADVTCVSDDGLDEANPFQLLGQEIEAAKTRLGMPPGGADLRVLDRTERVRAGERRSLRLPPRKRIREFVAEAIVPRLREQMRAGATTFHVEIDDERAGLVLSIDPARGRYSSGGHATYDVPASLTSNPLWKALRKKADQLRGAPGITGIVVGDGDCAALRELPTRRSDKGPGDIATELLRQCTSVDFVLLLSVAEESYRFGRAGSPTRHVAPLLIARDRGLGVRLEDLFGKMIDAMPRPVMMPVNAALRAREDDYDLGHHGGYGMNGGKIRIGSREFTEILAGLRTIRDDGAKHVRAEGTGGGRPNVVEAVVLANLRQGRLPRSISVVQTDENDDDWIEIEFGDPDPAISPLL